MSEMDPTIARLLGVIVARLLVDGWKPDEIGGFIMRLAMDIGRPSDADLLHCKACGQIMAEKGTCEQ